MLSVLLILVLGIVDFGRLLYTSQSVKSASREGARTGVVTGGSTTAIQTAARNAGDAAAALAGDPDGQVAVSVVVTNTSGSTVATPAAPADVCSATNAAYIAVTATIDFSFLTPLGSIPLLGGGDNGINDADRQVSSTTTMRCE